VEMLFWAIFRGQYRERCLTERSGLITGDRETHKSSGPFEAPILVIIPRVVRR